MKYLVFACLLALAASAEIYYAPGAYIATAPAAHSAAVAPLVYTRLQAAPIATPIATPIAATSSVETYNSVQTPDSFQQQFRADFKPVPVTYEYIY